MTLNDFGWVLIGMLISMVVYLLFEVIKKFSTKKGIPKDTDPMPTPTKLDDTIANIERKCNELDALINELKKSYK